ncbi:hypothetical protein J5U46_12035 [Micromonospora tulbaghiae]|uniref:Asn/Gln amidotransferase domain-containing protein n=1 Tax=Micromonospora tulbaghiae TaxID=479978 RepID=A0AAW4JPZ0_9ACTN|nr:hypothetical protein [Micromonospora tulbaghiae]MBO4140879.1 hypothetical protein [Micromonospora tulbaghiae]
MPIPLRDSGFDLDKLVLLKTIGGPVAQTLLDMSSAMQIAAPTPVPPPDFSARQITHFRQTCQTLQGEARDRLEAAMLKTSTMNCAQVAIILGQADLHLAAVTASPNAFSYEIELIAGSNSGLRWTEKFGRGDINASLAALAEARRFNVYSHLDLFTHGLEKSIGERFSYGNIPLGKLFSTEWLSGRGKFFTAYDLKYMEMIRSDLTLHRVHVPDPRAAHALIQPYVPRWTEAINSLIVTLSRSSPLRRVISSQSLLSHGTISLNPEDHKMFKRALPRLSLLYTQLLAQIPTHLREDAEIWLDLLTLSSDNKRQTRFHSHMDSPLRQRPILSAGAQRLVALPHKLSTDLSTVVDEIWSSNLKEAYFSARARSVETIALHTLTERLTGCRSIGGGFYTSRDGRIRGEVDGVVLWHDICIILEGKGGFLSIASRRGHDEAALADLRQTVGEGYFQAARIARVLEVDGSVDLRSTTGETLVVNGKSLRRMYVIIPTADDFHVVATKLPILWHKGVLPRGSLPLIISAQDLLLLADALTSATQLIAYLDFREEILANTWLHLADELEILGAFLGGLDVVGESQMELADGSTRQRFGRKRKVKIVNIAPMQQERYIDPWMARKFSQSLDGDPTIKPPARHDAESERALEDLWRNERDLGSITAGICLDRRIPGLIVKGCRGLHIRKIHVRRHYGISAVAFPSHMSIERVKKNPEVKKEANRSRYILYVEIEKGSPRLRHVALGRKHARFKAGNVRTALRSGVPLHNGWYERMEARRSKSFNRAAVAALEAEGLSRDIAVGVVRAGLANQVRETSRAGVDLARVAALWLGDVAQLAVEQRTHPASLQLQNATLVRILLMVESFTLPKKNVLPLLRLMVSERNSEPYAAAKEARLLANDDEELIRSAISAVLREEPEALQRLRSGKKSVRNYLLGRVAKRMGMAPRPDLAMQILTQATEQEGGWARLTQSQGVRE